MPESNQPKVSVIIPTYNRAALVCEAIDSVLDQSRDDFEILVIDDGSTDGTSSAVARYGERVRYLWQENRGMSAARNRAMDLARGEFLALLDSDDLWMPFKLELMVAVLERFPQAGFAFSDFAQLRAGGRAEPGGLRSWHQRQHDLGDVFEHVYRFEDLALDAVAGLPTADFRVCTGDIFRRVLSEHWVLPTTTLIRASAVRPDDRFPELDAWWGDSEFFARLSHRAGAVFVGLDTVYNRSHEDAVRLTRKDPIDQLEAHVALIDRLWRANAAFMRAHADEVDRVQCAELLRLARMQVAAGQRPQARHSLDRADRMARGASRMQRIVLRMAARLPGSRLAVDLVRRLKRSL